MALMARPGVLRPEGCGSPRFQTTEDAAASALSVMNTRPVLVAAQMVPVFCGVRAIQATAPPARLPQAVAVSCVDGAGLPIGTKSPQPGWAADVVNSGQLASRKSRSPPQSCVRQTENDPWKMVPACA